MSQRQLIKNIMNGELAERCGFWLGNPLPETIQAYNEQLGNHGLEDIQKFLGDDIRWITPHHINSTYNHPEGKLLRPWKAANPMGLANGPMSHIVTVEEADAYDWPQIRYLDLTETINQLENLGDYYRLSGFWSPFFHDLTHMLGMEDLLVKMYTHPQVIHAMLRRLCGFYLEANELFYKKAGDLIDAHFMGNDFGSQNDLLMSPELFEEFYMPWLKKFADQAHNHGYHSILHCCGSIYRIIDQLIDAGIDCIHPIQALATNMNAEYLAENFKGRIKFMGGIDTQHLLPYGTPDEIRNDTDRIIKLLAPGLIVSPSHEALMPGVPLENVIAMANKVKEMKQKRIVVIGSYLVALVMDTDRLPLQGETLLAHNFRQAHGGKGSNQAVQAARLGAPVIFFGSVGRDSYGDSFKDLCKNENIDTSGIKTSDKLPTGAGLIICSSDGHNIITIDIGANLELTPDAIDNLTTGILPGDIVLIQLEIPVESALYAAQVAKRLGATVIFNPAPAANLSDRDLSFIDIITPNETEARVSSGWDINNTITDEEAARKLYALGCKNVIITQGEKGCLVLNEKGSFTVPAFKFPIVVDSTGAGDSFNAALAVALLEGKSLKDACRFANASAGLACTKPDTIPSFHKRTEVDNFLTLNSKF